MEIIVPFEVTESDMTSSNIPITETLWTAGTYTLGQQRYEGITLYEVIVASTTDQPSIGVTLSTPSWKVVRNINRYNMFDGKIQSVSTNANTIEFTILPTTVVNAVAVFGALCLSVRVEIEDSVDGIVYDKTITSIEGDTVTDWAEFFFSPYTRQQDFAFTDLPQYANADVRITIDNGTDTAQVGEVVLGGLKNIGVTQYGVSTGIQDYSRKTVDEYGNFIVEDRGFAKRAQYPVQILADQASSIQTTLSKYRTTPTVFIGEISYASSIVYGFYKDFNIVLSNPPLAQCSLQVDGLS
jgi:hypothetical protein